jgi:signal transduction histidine kinase
LTYDLEKKESVFEILASMRKDAEFISWTERRLLAKKCFELISSGYIEEPLPELAVQLARDPKWEVRKDVADNLLLLPEDEFLRAASILQSDTNAFVQKSLKRAMDRRRQGRKSGGGTKQRTSQYLPLYAEIEKSCGAAAARKSTRIFEQFYNTLIGSSVHDMRNVLSPIKSEIFSLRHALAREDFSVADFERKLKKLSDMTLFMEQMLDDMKTYSEPLTAKKQTERLSRVIDKAHEMAIKALKAHSRFPGKVSFLNQTPDGVMLEIGHLQIIRAFSNIIKNAYDSYEKAPGVFSPGSINVSAEETGSGDIEITIADDGGGLSEAELEKVRQFMPGGTSKGGYGTGFGLPIAKRMIEWHNGAISINSKENAGSTVLVTLPLEGDDGQ